MKTTKNLTALVAAYIAVKNKGRKKNKNKNKKIQKERE